MTQGCEMTGNLQCLNFGSLHTASAQLTEGTWVDCETQTDITRGSCCLEDSPST